ncbi:hypothetical protein [Actinomadura chokoriensis]|uniref:hypothetical protein n=1 Tax=Actinomadura chokoriensis TaxID=454156 RepID=UPI0031FA26FF
MAAADSMPEQLADRQEGPHRYASPTTEDYLEGWRLWRAYRRDDHLNAGEPAARWGATEEHILAALPLIAAALKEDLHPER